ncbi:MAG: hypothetical protein UY55_C0005G0040 [Candidatus Jorgensenbacteria bacterium GW2011_GWB1_50_10]|uniref:Uncharacterized protein n=1 Tax=Candidatus Jorgensenbacteria bacterium GW2011_GWB1_50_10 TaxID=1618665 RepID=A0A0G1YIA6_9BACT|nr:MAG: hypothetical protein UY55_C0005G0040 [Candidatus Jorgensenbacteria bacterium GW2011_GWB1_50_10]
MGLNDKPLFPSGHVRGTATGAAPINHPVIIQQPEPERRHLSKRTIAIAAILIALLSVGIVGAVILSNVLTLGPYTTGGQLAIQVSQVTSPSLGDGAGQCHTSNSSYTGATELPSGSGGLIQSIWYKTGIRVQAPSGTSFNVIENYNVTYIGGLTPASGDLHIAYCDLSLNQWVDLEPSYDAATKTWSGTVTGTGFVLPNGYDATTPILVSVLNPGTYTSHMWFTSV